MIAVEANLGSIPVRPGGAVVLALGTIENARVALLSFTGIASYGRIGRNLMADLRSNMAIRIPRTALPANLPQELQASALFLKSRHTHPDGTERFFHLQITAAGLDAVGTNAEVELFQKIPDIDTFDVFRQASDTHVVVHIRAIGEMEPDNVDSHVTLDLNPVKTMCSVYAARLCRSQTRVFPRSGGQPAQRERRSAVECHGCGLRPGRDGTRRGAPQVLMRNRDGLGTTHHEAGTLRMGDDPNTSVTNGDARFHHVANAYVAGPALFPTIGSPNPMLTGTALARRLADHLALGSVPSDVAVPLFDGTLDNWRMSTIVGQGPGNSDPGNFSVLGYIAVRTGNDIGLF